MNLQDINIFEEYEPIWDSIVIDILDCIDTIDAIVRKYYDHKKDYLFVPRLVDYLSYVGYMDWKSPSSENKAYDLLITKEAFENIISKRDNTQKKGYVTFEDVHDNHIRRKNKFIRDSLNLIKSDGTPLSNDEKDTIYGAISRISPDGLWEENHNLTRFNFSDLLYYLNKYEKTQFTCDYYLCDNPNDFDWLRRKAMAFISYKEEGLSDILLDHIFDNRDNSLIEFFAIDHNADIKKNYQIILVNPDKD